MSITFGLYRDRTAVCETEINVSNRNAAFILSILEHWDSELCGVLRSEEVQEIAQSLLDPFAAALNVTQATVSQVPGKVTMIDCGLPDWKIDQYACFFAKAYVLMAAEDEVVTYS